MSNSKPVKSFPYSKLLQKHPLVFANIGSRSGSHGYWHQHRQYLHIIGFEPDQRSHTALPQTNREQHLPIGLYNEPTTLPLYQTVKPGDSSILKPNATMVGRFPTAPDFEITDQVTITVDTLDNLITSRQIPAPHFAQLDTQGSELFILQGADQALTDSIVGLEGEVEFIPLYHNQPLFADIDSYLRDHHFELFDLRRYFVKRKRGLGLGGLQGQLVAADAVYLRSAASFKQLIDKQPDTAAKQALLAHALLITHVYGYIDFAQELISVAKDDLSPSEQQHLHRYLKNQKSPNHRLPRFLGRGTLATLAARLARSLALPNRSGVLRDRLGNSQIDT